MMTPPPLSIVTFNLFPKCNEHSGSQSCSQDMLSGETSGLPLVRQGASEENPNHDLLLYRLLGFSCSFMETPSPSFGAALLGVTIRA